MLHSNSILESRHLPKCVLPHLWLLWRYIWLNIRVWDIKNGINIAIPLKRNVHTICRVVYQNKFLFCCPLLRFWLTLWLLVYFSFHFIFFILCIWLLQLKEFRETNIFFSHTMKKWYGTHLSSDSCSDICKSQRLCILTVYNLHFAQIPVFFSPFLSLSHSQRYKTQHKFLS